MEPLIEDKFDKNVIPATKASIVIIISPILISLKMCKMLKYQIILFGQKKIKRNLIMRTFLSLKKYSIVD